MTLSIYDSRIDPEITKLLIVGETITVLEYTARIIRENGRVWLDGGVYPGPYKEQSLWMPLYQSVEKAVTEIVEDWTIENVATIAPLVFKFPYRVGLISLEAQMGIRDDGQPYLTAKFTAQSPTGEMFIRSPAGERARMMVMQMVGAFIDKLGPEVRE